MIDNPEEITRKILIVEDDVGLNRLISKELERSGYSTISAYTGRETLEKLEQDENVIMILDFQLPDMNGKELLDTIISRGKKIPFIIITGNGDEKTAVEFMKRGAIDYIVKTEGILDILPQKILQAYEFLEKKVLLKEIQRNLLMTQHSINNSSESFFWLYPDGKFFDVNDTATKQLGYTKEEFQGMNISAISPDLPVEFRFELLHKTNMATESVFITKEGETYPVEIGSSLYEFEGSNYIFTHSKNIALRKEAERQKDLHSRILSILNRNLEWNAMMQELLVQLKKHSGFDAVGLRLKEGDDFPYFITDGFDDNFIQMENSLLCRSKEGQSPKLACTCGLVLEGNCPVKTRGFTEKGSFWTNNYADHQFLHGQDLRLFPRNRCIAEGYRSVALIPLVSDNRIFGMLQLNDRKPDKLSEEKILFYEELSNHIGIAFQRMEAEKRLQLSEERYRSIIEGGAEGILILQISGFAITFTNPAMRNELGYAEEDFKTLRFSDMHPVEYLSTLEQTITNLQPGKPVFLENIPYLKKDRTQVVGDINISHVLIDGIPCAVEYFMDASERKKLEEEKLLIQEKMEKSRNLEAIGTLASGMAHDINNTLAPISLYTDALLEGEEKLSEKTRRYIKTIQQASRDIEGTINRLRKFYQKNPRGSEIMLPINLENLIEQTIEMTHPRWKDIPEKSGRTVNIRKELGTNGSTLNGIESEIREALINLVFNAVDAMPEGGEIVIKTGIKNDIIQIEVTDTGTGMTPEQLSKCMEPFYTTKGEKGSGLGMASVFGTMRRHDGNMEIESAVGLGTTIRLLFPMKKPISPVLAETEPEKSKISGRILYIDDEETLRETFKELLEIDGHTVDTAESGHEGLKIFSEKLAAGIKYNVVFTDLGMPGMDGWEVAEQLRKMDQGIHIVMLSGWGSFIESEKEQRKVDAILGKPPKLEDIRRLIRELI